MSIARFSRKFRQTQVQHENFLLKGNIFHIIFEEEFTKYLSRKAIGSAHLWFGTTDGLKPIIVHIFHLHKLSVRTFYVIILSDGNW